MKIEVGTVYSVDGDMAEVKAGRHSDCKNCGACPGSDSAVILVKNTVGAKVGDRVTFELQEAGAIKGAFVIFILPLALIFIGALAGFKLAAAWGIGTAAGAIAGGAVFFAVSVVIIRLADRRAGKKNKAMPEILKVIK